MDNTENKSNDDEMKSEYDFTDGIHSKHYQAYRKGHTVTIHQEDGTTTVQKFTIEDGAVMLDPYVKQYFPDSESVNYALRTLIKLVPHISSKSDAS